MFSPMLMSTDKRWEVEKGGPEETKSVDLRLQDAPLTSIETQHTSRIVEVKVEEVPVKEKESVVLHLLCLYILPLHLFYQHPLIPRIYSQQYCPSN